jgi:O-antigen/teichoic acid export membrane protein
LAGLQFDPVRLKRAYQASTRFSCLAVYPCFVGLGAVAPDLVEALFGHRWEPSSPYVAVLGFLVLVQAPRLQFAPLLTALGRPRDSLVGLIAELLFMLSVAASFGMPSLPWAMAIWVASECLLTVVSGWVIRRTTGYSAFEQFGGVLNPLLASLLMAAVVTATRMQMPADLGAVLRLAVLVPLGAAIFAGAIFLLDRQLVKDFLIFARIAFERSPKTPELP